LPEQSEGKKAGVEGGKAAIKKHQQSSADVLIFDLFLNILNSVLQSVF
jgi:hypothetical protein